MRLKRFFLILIAALASVAANAQLNGYFGRVRLSPKSTLSSDTPGTIYYNSDSGKFVFRQASGWVDFMPSNGPTSSGNIKGNLTTNRIAYAVDADSIAGDSTLTWNPSTKKLRLSNNLNLSSNGDLIALTQTASAATGYNIQIGYHPPANDGDHNINIGNLAGYQQTASSHFNVLIGEQACSACNGASENTAVGYRAIQSAKGEDNAGFGFGAGMALGTSTVTTSQRNNNFIGYYTAAAQMKGGTPPPYDYIDGNNSLFIGPYAGTGDVAGQRESGQMNINHTIFSRYNTDANPPPFPQTGNVGIYVPMPTARLHLPAGAATANKAPIKLTAGTLLTTTEAGTIEYDGTNLYFTATSSGARTRLNITTVSGSFLVMPTLPTNCTGAPSGALYNDAGTLKICP